MKPATAKAKGALTETLLVACLRDNGWPRAERRRLTGRWDQGDVAGMHGPAGDVCVEVKSGARIDLPGWITELLDETTNANADTGFVAIRLKGRPNPDQWVAALPLPWLLDLLRRAQFAEPRNTTR